MEIEPLSTGQFRKKRNAKAIVTPEIKIAPDNIVTENIYSDFDESLICIPICINKKPACKWEKITKTPTHLFKPEYNIAILTGKINNITVVDIDMLKPDSNELDGLKKYYDLLQKYNNGHNLITPTCKSQSKGLHLYFKYDADVKMTTKVGGYTIDIRNDKGLIICPPSIGEKGAYTWKNNYSIHNTELSEMPIWLKEWIISSMPSKKRQTKINNKKTYAITKSDYIFIYEKTDIIELLNNLPKNYLDTYDDWFTITSCLKSEDLKEIWNEWSIKSEHYGLDDNEKQWNSFVPKLNIQYLCVIARIEELEGFYNIIHKTKKIKFFTKLPDSTINAQHIEQTDILNIDDDYNRNIIIKSPCGTGKTSLSCEYIKNLCEDSGYKILSITVRVSLACQQVTNFKKNKIDMMLYNKIDNDILNEQNRLIIHLDSIIRLDIKNWHSTVVYLDEVASLMSYMLTSKTLDKKRVMIFTIFYRLMKQASYVLCTDADVNDMVLEYFEKIGIKYYLIENKYVSDKNTIAYEYDDKEYMIQKMAAMLLNDEKILVCFDSKTEMDIIVERLKKFCEDNELDKQLNNFLVYSSTSGDEDDFLCVNDRWKMKNIFYTPKITIGLSFDNKTPRNVFLIALGNSINYFGFVQQISRCRNINQLHYYVAKRYQKLKFDNADDVKKYYTELLQNYESLSTINRCTTTNDNYDSYYDISEYDKLANIVDNGGANINSDTDEWVMHNSVFNEMFFIHEYYENILRSAPREQFRWMLEAKGFEVNYVKDTLDDNKKNEVIANTKNAKLTVKDNQDAQNKRALYNKESSLTHNEIKLMENAKRRALYLGIDFSKKVDKKKWEKYLIDDKMFTKHCAYRLLCDNDIDLNKKITDYISKDYNVLNASSLFTKIKLIKLIENTLGIATLDVDTQRDMDRFDDDVEISESNISLIRKVFRIGGKTAKINSDKFEFWYYELIQCYKNVVGNDFFIFKKIKINGNHHRKYICDNDMIKDHNELLSKRDACKKNDLQKHKKKLFL